MRQLALGAAAADVVNPGRGGALDFGDGMRIECRGKPRFRARNMRPGMVVHQ
jgi:hypothetical protein